MKTLLSATVRLYQYAIRDSMRIAKAGGLRELLRQRGWRFVVCVAGYYLVRDTMIYVVLPVILARVTR